MLLCVCVCMYEREDRLVIVPRNLYEKKKQRRYDRQKEDIYENEGLRKISMVKQLYVKSQICNRYDSICYQ